MAPVESVLRVGAYLLVLMGLAVAGCLDDAADADDPADMAGPVAPEAPPTVFVPQGEPLNWTTTEPLGDVGFAAAVQEGGPCEVLLRANREGDNGVLAVGHREGRTWASSGTDPSASSGEASSPPVPLAWQGGVITTLQQGDRVWMWADDTRPGGLGGQAYAFYYTIDCQTDSKVAIQAARQASLSHSDDCTGGTQVSLPASQAVVDCVFGLAFDSPASFVYWGPAAGTFSMVIEAEDGSWKQEFTGDLDLHTLEAGRYRVTVNDAGTLFDFMLAAAAFQPVASFEEFLGLPQRP